MYYSKCRHNFKTMFVSGAAVVIIATTGCGDEGAEKPKAVSQSAVKEDDKLPREEGKVKEHKSGEWSPGLSDAEKATLFRIAEDTLQCCVKGSRKPFSFDGYEITPKMKVMTATFVTLKIRGHLRGCIGSLAPVAEMYKSVHDNAVSSAMRDFRFRPVQERELPDIDVHISLLSPIEPIRGIDAFVIGAHGIIIEKGGHRAVYLPEVAVEQNWSKDETLSSLSMKAGMDRNAWRDGASFKVFSSVVLSR